MKKLFLSSVVLLMAFAAQAQTKIAPKLENGFKAVYTEEATIASDDKQMKVTTEDTYAVSDVTANGAVITVTTALVSNDAGDDAAMQLQLIPQKMVEGIAIKVSTDADGKVLRVLNIDEVTAKAKQNLETAISQLIDGNPALAAVPKDALVGQFSGILDEEAITKSFATSGVLALNGLTVANGAQDHFVNGEGLKMKRMFFMAGKNIITNATLDMTRDDMKALVIKEIEEKAPEQAEMVKENIDMVVDQMKVEASEKSTYTLQDNGWVKTIKTESEQGQMGQKAKRSSVVTLKQ